MMKRLVLALCMFALLVPSGAQADPVTYTTPFGLGPQGGDNMNTRMRDPATGQLSVIRHQPFGISGGLGCGGSGGFSYFEVVHEASTPVSKATIEWRDGAFTPFSYVNLGVRKGSAYLYSQVDRQPMPGDGKTSVEFSPTTGTLVAWFGLQLSSACPSIEAAHAVFEAITFE